MLFIITLDSRMVEYFDSLNGWMGSVIGWTDGFVGWLDGWIVGCFDASKNWFTIKVGSFDHFGGRLN